MEISAPDATTQQMKEKRFVLPENLTTVTKLSKAVALVLFILLPFIGFVLGYKYYALTKNSECSNEYVQEKTELPSMMQTATPPPISTTSIALSSDSNLPHELLPGFNLNLPTGWKVSEIKQFGETDDKGFKSTYFPTCAERCMGIRLSKETISLDLLFDVAFDSNSFKCSNSATYTKVNNSWTRVQDSSGYFYTRNVEINKTLEKGKIPSPFGKPTDEWSAVQDTTYNICVLGDGEFLKEPSLVERGKTQDEVPILMEFPRVKEEVGSRSIQEIDSIIRSIQGLK